MRLVYKFDFIDLCAGLRTYKSHFVSVCIGIGLESQRVHSRLFRGRTQNILCAREGTTRWETKTSTQVTNQNHAACQFQPKVRQAGTPCSNLFQDRLSITFIGSKV